MFKNEYVLSVDFKKRMSKTFPIFVQNDNASLVFRVFDNGNAFDFTGLTKVTISHQLPDGKVIIGNGAKETLNGETIIQYTYLGSEMELSGVCLVKLSLFSGDKKVSIPPFKIEIIRNH